MTGEACRTRILRAKFPGVVSRCFSVLAVATAISLGIAYLFVGDGTAWGELLTVWPPLLWLFVLIPLATFGASRRHFRWFLAAIGTVTLFAVASIDWIPLLRLATPAPAAPSGLRLATWNMGGGTCRKSDVLAELERFSPDICVLQETPDGSASFCDEDLSGYWAGWHWLDSGDCGILSRYPFEPLETERVGPWTPPQAVICHLPHGRAMVVVNVRLMLPSLVLNPLSAPERLKLIRDHAERLKQNRCLSDEIRRIRDIHTTLPLVLAGDFNVRGDVASLDPLRAILRDAWHETGRGWGGTMTSSFPVARIDQCWVSDGVRPVSARVAPTSHSDHRILLVDLQPDSSRAAKSSP